MHEQVGLDDRKKADARVQCTLDHIMNQSKGQARFMIQSYPQSRTEFQIVKQRQQTWRQVRGMADEQMTGLQVCGGYGRPSLRSTCSIAFIAWE